ncbi:UNVERIFIED_CONTAM: hypothetical protein FKN15_064032 [Acipenser sinensis]
MLWSEFANGSLTSVLVIRSSLFEKTKSRHASPLVGSFTNCVRKQSFVISTISISSVVPPIGFPHFIWEINILIQYRRNGSDDYSQRHVMHLSNAVRMDAAGRMSIS